MILQRMQMLANYVDLHHHILSDTLILVYILSF